MYINMLSGNVAMLHKKGELQRCIAHRFDYIEEYIVDNTHGTDFDFKAKAIHFDIVLVCGGDGTLNFVVNVLFGMAIEIWYLPCGTQNDFARACIQKGLIGKKIVVDIGALDNQRFCYVCAAGTLSEVGYIVPRKQKKQIGKLAYLLAAARRFKKHSIEASLQVGQELLNGKFSLILFAKTEFVAGQRFSKNKTQFAVDDGLCKLILIEAPQGAFSTLKLFCRYWRVFGKKLDGNKQTKHIKYLECACVHLTIKEPTVFCMDGEKLEVSNDKEHTIKVYKQMQTIQIIGLQKDLKCKR